MLITHQRESGLLVANEAMDEAALSRALKRLDRRLVLQKHAREGVEGGWVWKVVCVVSDRYAPIVFTWMDEQGRPLPLSSALVDEFQRQMLGARNKRLTADEFNARLLEQRKRDAQALTEAVIEEHRPYFERERVSVALGASKPRYWRREGARPKSGRSQ